MRAMIYTVNSSSDELISMHLLKPIGRAFTLPYKLGHFFVEFTAKIDHSIKTDSWLYDVYLCQLWLNISHY